MKECAFDGCANPAVAKGLCHNHRVQQRNGEELRPLRPRYGWGGPPKICEFEGCEGVMKAKGLCGAHWLQRWKGQELKPLGKKATWRPSSQGYVRKEWRIGDEFFRVFQHREVMEEHLGRPLLPEETVHHVNGVRSDNRLENLQLWSSNHPAGQRVADKIRWAHEILEQYGSDPAAYEDHLADKNGSAE